MYKFNNNIKNDIGNLIIPIPPEFDKITTCPSCKHKQESTNEECDACGLVFEKHLAYIPTVAYQNKYLATPKVTAIRRAENILKTTEGQKMNFLINCSNNELIDLAAYHLKKKDDQEGINTLKKIILSNIRNNRAKTFFTSFHIRPALAIGSLFLLFLIVIAFMLNRAI